MKNIYKAPLRSLVITQLDIQDGAVKLVEFDTPIVRKDVPFYRGVMNNYISFEHGTELLDEGEALTIVQNEVLQRPKKPYPTCMFVVMNEMKYSHSVDSRNFRALKKFYKQVRKEEEQKQKKR